jgi:hypothetical protein
MQFERTFYGLLAPSRRRLKRFSDSTNCDWFEGCGRSAANLGQGYLHGIKAIDMVIFKRAFDQVSRFSRAFLLINVAYFGIVCGGMVYGSWDRENRDAYMAESKRQAAEFLPAVLGSDPSEHFVRTVALMFLVNLFGGSLLYITIPSLLVPFSGLLLGGVRAFVWGLVFTPDLTALNGASLAYGALIGLLLILEGEGYVLAMLGAYIQGKAFVFPQCAGATTRLQGYKLGGAWCLQIYALVAGVLAIAAMYEGVLVFFLKPLLK